MEEARVLESTVFGRRDSQGVWHPIATAACEECGCPYDYSIDEPGLVWEAGEDISDECLDPVCDCHVIPVEGLRFRLNLVP
jgi:hypothetical protein